MLPQRRLTDASLPPPAAASIGLAVPYALLLVIGRNGVRRERIAAAVLLPLLGLALFAADVPVVYRAIWAIARSTPLVAVVTLLWMLTERGDDDALESAAGPSRSRTRAFLLVTMAAFTTLVQLPYATPTYFCYAAPSVVLAIAAIVAAQDHGPRLVHAVVALFFFGFAALYMNQSYGWNLGAQFLPYHPTAVLAASIFQFGTYRIAAAKARLAAAGIPVRL